MKVMMVALTTRQLGRTVLCVGKGATGLGTGENNMVMNSLKGNRQKWKILENKQATQRGVIDNIMG